MPPPYTVQQPRVAHPPRFARLALILLVSAHGDSFAQQQGAPPTASEMVGSYQAFTGRSDISHRVFLEGYRYLRPNSAIGMWGFAYAEAGYLSAIYGLFGEVASGLSAGVAAGIEYVGPEVGSRGYAFARYAGTVEFTGHGVFWDLYCETGASQEHWCRSELIALARGQATLGALLQTGDGAGPKLTFSTRPRGAWALRGWGAAMFRLQDGMRLNGPLLGLDVVWSRP